MHACKVVSSWAGNNSGPGLHHLLGQLLAHHTPAEHILRQPGSSQDKGSIAKAVPGRSAFWLRSCLLSLQVRSCYVCWVCSIKSVMRGHADIARLLQCLAAMPKPPVTIRQHLKGAGLVNVTPRSLPSCRRSYVRRVHAICCIQSPHDHQTGS